MTEAAIVRPVPARSPKPYIVLADADKDREGWLAARKSTEFLTASNLSRVLGLEPGRVRLWYEMAGLIESNSAEIGEHEYVQLGHVFEPLIAKRFTQKTGRRVKRAQKLLRSKTAPIACTVDYWWSDDAGTKGILECKSTGNSSLWPAAEGPAQKWIVQLQAQLLVTQAPMGTVGALIGAPAMRHDWADFAPDPALWQVIIEETEAFLESLKAGKPPIDWDEDSLAVLRQRLGVDPEKAVTLPPEAQTWAEEMQAAKAAVKQWEERVGYYQALFLDALGDASEGVLPGGEVMTAKPYEKREYTVRGQTVRPLLGPKRAKKDKVLEAEKADATALREAVG